MIYKKESQLMEGILDVILTFDEKTDSDSLINLLITKMREVANCEGATLYVVEDDKLIHLITQNELLNLNKHENEPSMMKEVSLSQCNETHICAYVAKNKTHVNIKDVYLEEVFGCVGSKEFDKLMNYKTVSLLTFPLFGEGGQVVGVMQLVNAKNMLTNEYTYFEEDILRYLKSIANIIGLALLNLQYANKISDMFYMQKILEIVVAFNSEKDFYKLVEKIITKMREITNCQGGTLYVLEDNSLYYKIVQNEALNTNLVGEEVVNYPSIVLDPDNVANVSAYCAINNKMINIDDVYENMEFNFQGPKDFDKKTGYKTKSMVVFPLADMDGRVVGVIQLINSQNPKTGEVAPFNEKHLVVLQSLSSIAGVALVNVRYTQEIKDLFNSFVKIMSQAIDERTPYNMNHTKSIAKYVENFTKYLSEQYTEGEEYYFSENRQEQLIMAAFLHDIGKIVTPLDVMNKPTRLGKEFSEIENRISIRKLQIEIQYIKKEILQAEFDRLISEIDDAYETILKANTAGYLNDETVDKIKTFANLTYKNREEIVCNILDEYHLDCLSVQKGTLTENERVIMQEHVSITERLLTNIKFNQNYKDVPIWAPSHHEFLDGTGYPKKLKNSQIPIESRILTMIDIFEALTAKDRPYKKAMPREKAIAILQEMVSEGKLDGEVVEIFVKSNVWQMEFDFTSIKLDI